MIARCFTIADACPGCHADMHIADEPGQPTITVVGHADDCPVRPLLIAPGRRTEGPREHPA